MYRVTRKDLKISSKALNEALENVTLDNDFDIMAEAREGFRRMGDLDEDHKEASSLTEESSEFAKKVSDFRKDLGLTGP